MCCHVITREDRKLDLKRKTEFKRNVAVLYQELEPPTSGITNRKCTGNPSSAEPVWYTSHYVSHITILLNNSTTVTPKLVSYASP